MPTALVKEYKRYSAQLFLQKMNHARLHKIHGDTCYSNGKFLVSSRRFVRRYNN